MRTRKIVDWTGLITHWLMSIKEGMPFNQLDERAVGRNIVSPDVNKTRTCDM